MTTLPCPPDRWPRFSTLLDAAMDVPQINQDTWLLALQGDDRDLRPWLEHVLRGGQSMAPDAFEHAPPLSSGEAGRFTTGDVLGPYRLASLLGEGGMGQVWRASRSAGHDDGPRRDVALKLPHIELLAGPFRQRFRRERDVLATLTHPHIAALYDAGISAEGHPYMALELVTGAPITAYCQASAAPVERIVDLIRQVLDALAYAHARLIVHRDIKPSNVMVTADGQVKLLDFGIAKLLDADVLAEAPLTEIGRLATPGYAPPEQMEGGAITISADLFATGVLLFELCTGQRPPRLHAGGADAPLASSRAASAVAASGGAAPSRRLRGDLDAIIARALAIDPAQRYSSADAFAGDLRRWRMGLPVSARRVGWPVRAAKLVRRNKAGVALAGVLALALAGGTTGIAWQAHRAAREAARANAVKDFLIGLFEQTDPHGGGKPTDTMTARELLDNGTRRAEAAFAGQPETEIELLGTLGRIYDGLEDSARSQQIWARRLDLARSLYGQADPRVLDGTLILADSEAGFLEEDKAKALLETIRPAIFNQYGPDNILRARWLVGRAHSLRATHGGRDEAIADLQAAIAVMEKLPATGDDFAGALTDLEGFQYDAERYTESLATLNRMRAVLIAHHQYDTIYELFYDCETAARLEHLGRPDEAEALFILAENLAARRVGRQGLWYLHAVSSHAALASLRGDPATAERLLQGLLNASMKQGASTGSDTSVRRVYGAALAREGRAAEAVPILEQALAETIRHGHDEANLRRTQGWLGDAYDKTGRAPQARAMLLAARNDWILNGPAAGVQALAARERWARFLLEHGESAAAEAEFNAVIEQTGNAPSAPAAMSEAGLARLAVLAGDLPAADRYSTAAVTRLLAVTMEYDVRMRVDVRLARAETLQALGHRREAHDLAAEALAIAEQYDAPVSARIARAAALEKAAR